MKIIILLFFILSSSTVVANFDKELLKTFVTKNFDHTNVSTLAQDKALSSWRSLENGSYVVLSAYPGPIKFNQIAIWCDQCGVKGFTAEQVSLCEKTFKGIYQHVTQKEWSQELGPEFKKLEIGKHRFLKVDNPNYKVRVSLGALKCDGNGGDRVRIDLFNE